MLGEMNHGYGACIRRLFEGYPIVVDTCHGNANQTESTTFLTSEEIVRLAN